eukprot:459430-Rhodomonas_salina.1
MRFAVLRWRMGPGHGLGPPYAQAMPGTSPRPSYPNSYQASVLSYAVAMCGTELAYQATNPRLRVCYALPGTDLAYSSIKVRGSYAMCGTELAYQAPLTPHSPALCRLLLSAYPPAVSTPGNQLEDETEADDDVPPTTLRACYALSGGRAADDGRQRRDPAIVLRARYAMSGTDLANALSAYARAKQCA